MSLPLAGRRILIVEDDPIIGLDLRETLEMAGATVVGVARDVARAYELLERFSIDAAVLDNLIAGGDSGPVADLLIRRGTNFLFHTSQRQGLDSRYPFAQIIDKPSRPGELVHSLQKLLETAPEQDDVVARNHQTVGTDSFDPEP
jgi:DNA-binding response OmpR family regulator